MTRHESLYKQLEKAYARLELKKAFPNEWHNELTECLLISIAGSLAIIADTMNPEASEVKE